MAYGRVNIYPTQEERTFPFMKHKKDDIIEKGS
jgi:hypothetical protein